MAVPFPFVANAVLTAAQMNAITSLPTTAKTASATLTAAESVGYRVTMTNASATTITINTSVYAAGDTVFITNLGAGTCTITAGTATVSSAASLALPQYGSGLLVMTATGTGVWYPSAGSAATAGTIQAYAGSSAPAGYLICNGDAISRTTFAVLFAITSTTYGVGDGSTTFNIPDLRGRVAVGVGTNAAVNALALSDGVAVANRRPQHRHTAHTHTMTGGYSPVVANVDQFQAGSGRSGSGGSIVAVDGGSGTATDSLDAPAWLTVNYIIAF